MGTKEIDSECLLGAVDELRGTMCWAGTYSELSLGEADKVWEAGLEAWEAVRRD